MTRDTSKRIMYLALLAVTLAGMLSGCHAYWHRGDGEVIQNFPFLLSLGPVDFTHKQTKEYRLGGLPPTVRLHIGFHITSKTHAPVARDETINVPVRLTLKNSKGEKVTEWTGNPLELPVAYGRDHKVLHVFGYGFVAEFFKTYYVTLEVLEGSPAAKDVAVELVMEEFFAGP